MTYTQSNPEPNMEFRRPTANLVKPGGFWIRFGATIIDLLIIVIVTLPLDFLLGLFMITDPNIPGYWRYQAVNILLSTIISGSYYGYFYSKKGGSPGKLLLKLRVVDADTGTNLGFWQGFFRDSIGKWVSTMILGIGFLMAAFRRDKAALHDLMLNSRVVRQK